MARGAIRKNLRFPSQAGIMLEILPTPTVSDEKHKSATNRAEVLEGWSIGWRGDFQPLKRELSMKTIMHLSNVRSMHKILPDTTARQV